jgi:hypothetical protein
MLAKARAVTGFSSLLSACAMAACLLAAPGDAAAKGKAKPAGVEVTFTGYQTLGGGRGMVFVELSQLVAVEVHKSGQVIEYKLVGASVPLRNNRNPLLLRDFGSSAITAVLVPDKKAVRLVITLRSAITPTHRMVAKGKGAVLEVDLPAAGAK